MVSIWQTLWFRLTAAFLFTAVVGVLVVGVLANRATTTGFRSYLTESQWHELQESLANLYARQGDWQGAGLLLSIARPGQGNVGLVLLDEHGQPVALSGSRPNRPTSRADADIILPILVDDQMVGTLLVRFPAGASHMMNIRAQAADRFLLGVNRALWIGGGLAVLSALVMGSILAWGLTRPVTQLTQATREMAQGHLDQRVAPAQGELGELATSFNQMAQSLLLAERQRQQLLADVAHELRTPLSIMRGHLEAMLDGVFELSADNLALVHEESLLLGRLIEDLRTLSLVESGNLSLNIGATDLGKLAEQTVAAFAPLAEAEGVRLTLTKPPTLPPVLADRDRMQQVLSNLLTNGLRYAQQNKSDQPHLNVSLAVTNGRVQLAVADNGPGLSPEAQRHAFDRFWRAERSRSRDQGGSGLGLAICQAIISAHNGRIWAEDTPEGGATFVVELNSG